MELRIFVSNLDRDSSLIEGTLYDNIDPDRICSEDEVIVALRHFDLIGYIVKSAKVRTLDAIIEYFEGLDSSSLYMQEV